MKPQYIGIGILGLLVFGGLLFFIYGRDTDAPESGIDTVTVGDITLSDAWVAETIGAQPRTAAYLLVSNSGETEDRIVAVSSRAAAMAHLHETVTDNTVTRMEAVDAVIIPAHGEVTFAPGGLHIMMTALNGPLTAGDTVSLTLGFLEAGDVTIVAPVRSRSEMIETNMDDGSDS